MDVPLPVTLGSPKVSMMLRIVYIWSPWNMMSVKSSSNLVELKCLHQTPASYSMCLFIPVCFTAEINILLHLTYKQFRWPYCSYVVGTLKHHHHQWQFQNQVFGHYSLVTIRVGFRWEPWSQGMYRKSGQMMLIWVSFTYTFWYFLSSKGQLITKCSFGVIF